eukprot:TRINITY_DN4524_c0_g2_i1.p1 TRINITY_DN4524_c0_g2~~TRINITY_DN4524_c0_g2_i1.p1  ORF type:complete len:841 (+),score=291.54 TRINITY_DN4524_c0_g2_i1:108-2525(+)
MGSWQFNIPIMAVILSAMLMSTSSSLAGGLLIYFQGLDSLERSMKQTSESEVRSLRDGVLAVDEKFVEYVSLVKQFFYSEQQINTTDTHEWTRRMNSLFFAQVNSSETLYYVAFMLHSYGAQDAIQDMVYATVWADLLKDGSREFVLAESGPFIEPTNMNTEGQLIVNAYSMTEQTGNIEDFLYVWNSSFRGYAADGVTYTIDPRNDVTDVASGFAPLHRIPDAHSERKAGPRLWHSPAKDFLYSYHNIDAIFVPPAAPHVWNKYRAVRITVGYLTDAFLEVFVRHAKVEGTTILLVNRREGRVLASTEPGFTVVPPECQDMGWKGEFARDMGCFMNFTSHFTNTLRDAFIESGKHPSGDFTRADLGGSEHFLRRSTVSDEKELIWLRPVSTVESEVREALNLLILFVVLVLVFDTVTAVIEVVYIAMPLKKLLSAIRAIGEMQTEEAQFSITRYEDKSVMVTEIRGLMEGMLATIGRLEEFRTFMPEVLVGNHDSEQDDTQDESTVAHTQRSGSKTSHTFGSATSKSSLDPSRMPAETNLKLYLSSKRHIGILALNIVKWSTTVGAQEDSSMMQAHSDIVSHVLQVTASKGGTVDSFQGDRFLIGWNTVKRAADVIQKVCHTAMQLHEVLNPHKLSISLCSGKGRMGNLGNHNVRRFTVVSPLIAWAMLLEQFNKEYGLRVTTDDTMMKCIKNMFLYRVLDAIVTPKTKTAVPVGEIIRPVEAQNTEWMYQLEDVENRDEFAVCNTFALAVIREDWAAIRSTPDKPSPYMDLFLASHRDRAFHPLSLFGQRGAQSRQLALCSPP